MVVLIFAFVFLSAMDCTCGQVFSFGRCPSVTTKPDFNITLYLGQWFENVRFFAIFEIGAECVTANYSLKDNGHVKVVNSARGKEPAIGDAYVPDPNEPAKLKVRFNEMQPGGDYWVLMTDYEDFSIVYSCSDYIFFHSEFCWLLTRQRDGIQPQKKHDIFAFLDGNGINTSKFRKTVQTGCEEEKTNADCSKLYCCH